MDALSDDDGWTRIDFAPGAHWLSVALAPLCEHELAIDIQLRDGSLIGGVLAEVVSGHLALRGFNDETVEHTDELMLIALEDIARVVVP